MSIDIERLLAAAADDSAQPLHGDVEAIVARGRRSVRNHRIAAVATATLTTAAVIGAVGTWSATRHEGIQPAGSPTNTVTVDVKTGRIIDNETGKPIAAAPPVSPMSDSELISRCMTFDKSPSYEPTPKWDKAGPLDARWSVAVKTGAGHLNSAVLVSPDRTVASVCQINDDRKLPSWSYGRRPLTPATTDAVVVNAGYADGLRMPSTVTKVLVDVPGEAQVREALMGKDGFYTLGVSRRATATNPAAPKAKPRIRGYAADGRKVVDREIPFVVMLPPMPQG